MRAKFALDPSVYEMDLTIVDDTETNNEEVIR